MFYCILGKICDTAVIELDANAFMGCRSGGRLTGCSITAKETEKMRISRPSTGAVQGLSQAL